MVGNVVQIGDVMWHWAANLVCAGPDERLVVIPDAHGDLLQARMGLEGAERMEWRDAGFRKWRIRRSPEGIIFSSHYARLGPVDILATECLAGMANERLEQILTAARAGADASVEGNPPRR